jgi:hypothetical protein
MNFGLNCWAPQKNNCQNHLGHPISHATIVVFLMGVISIVYSQSIVNITPSGQNKVCFSQCSLLFPFYHHRYFHFSFFVLCFEIAAAYLLFIKVVVRSALVRIGTICYSVYRPFSCWHCAEASVQHFLFVVCTLYMVWQNCTHPLCAVWIGSTQVLFWCADNIQVPLLAISLVLKYFPAL